MNTQAQQLTSREQRIKNFLSGVAFGLIIVSIMVAVSFFTTGCSNQYRTSTAQVDEQTLMQIYGDISTATDASLVSATALNNSGSTQLYFSEDDANRPAESVVAFEDMSLFSNNWMGGMTSTDAELNHAQVFFVDGFNENGDHKYQFKVALEDLAGNKTYFAAESIDGTASFSGNEFSVDMNVVLGGSAIQQITIYSNDVNTNYSEELGGTVKFEVYDADGYYIGQFSALHLYN